eukprot:4004895-Heterocapsa_arctica.AAC.1
MTVASQEESEDPRRRNDGGEGLANCILSHIGVTQEKENKEAELEAVKHNGVASQKVAEDPRRRKDGGEGMA